MTDTSVTYYARRAPYYDDVYAKLERQPELIQLGQQIQATLSGKSVLEIACGTGYWTQVIAETAVQITATDINETMLEIARQKEYPGQNVAFQAIDMYALKPGGDYDTLFGGFIWSHIPLQALE
jgi:ubiquinone/menaquinone biosynthesis C-methylase UbiE